MSFHLITVARQGTQFRLMNHGNPCGPRLYKGTGSGAHWPFENDETWWIQTTQRKAEIAASELQAYLDKRETQLA